MAFQKEAQAFKEDKNGPETAIKTEEGFSNMEQSFLSERDSVRNEISVEAASLLLAMKLLNLVDPDFYLRPSSPPPLLFSPSPNISIPSYNLPANQPSQSSLPPDPESSSNRSTLFCPSHLKPPPHVILEDSHFSLPQVFILLFCGRQPSPLSIEAHECDSALFLL